MKKLYTLLLAGALCLSLSACGGTNQTEGSPTEQPTETESTPTPTPAPELTGEWKQVNNDSDDSYQTATIQDGTIEVYWVTDSGDTKALYWAGTYVAPTTADEPYKWDSANDKEKTNVSMLSSGDDTKTFTYEKDQISYEVTALGVTTTVRLEKQQ